ncbi:MAG: hypothetical protein PHG00_02525 [Methylococcales bacterium]|nr:hypothetical protein [Methylococcales bacterium]
MSEYEKSKKARRIASVVYLLIMAFVMGGTYLSQQQKEALQKEEQAIKVSGGLPEASAQN